MFNFDNAHSTHQTTGPLPTWAKLNNLQYFRAAMQESVNQAYVIDHVDNGYGIQSFSAIPSYPKNSFNAGVVNPYPYSATKGKALMRSHGWNTKRLPGRLRRQQLRQRAVPDPEGRQGRGPAPRPRGIPSYKQQALDEVASIKKDAGIQVTPRLRVRPEFG